MPVAVPLIAAAATTAGTVYAANQAKKGAGTGRAFQNVSPEQASLYGPLAAFFGNELHRPYGAGNQIYDVLSGTDPFTNELAGSLYQNALLKPALRGFEENVRPAISSQFAGIGGSLSSRHSRTLTDAYGDVMERSQETLASILPNLLGLKIQGIQSAEQTRLAPIQSAISFALGNTQSQSQQSPWWGVLNNALGGLSTLGGAYLGGGFGGASATSTPNFNYAPANYNFASTPRF